MMWLDVLCHPVWAISTALLALVVRLQRRGCWDPRSCPVRLNGKTAIVTGANTGRLDLTGFSLLIANLKVLNVAISRLSGKKLLLFNMV